MIALAVLALLAAPPPPLECPAGTELQGARPMEGFEEYCAGRQLDGKLRREGPARSYYDDGSVWVEARYHDGVLDGPFVERYRTGQVARQGAYQAGGRVGAWRFFHEDGTLQEESSWRKGVQDGPFRSFWPGGKPRSEGRHCLGVQCGEWRSFDQAGRLEGRIEYGTFREEP